MKEICGGGGGQFKLDFAPPHFPIGNFEKGVPYRITVTAVSPEGLYPAPSVWTFREELGKQWGLEMEGSGTLANLDPLGFVSSTFSGTSALETPGCSPRDPHYSMGRGPKAPTSGPCHPLHLVCAVWDQAFCLHER